jgi:hypothetical protein
MADQIIPLTSDPDQVLSVSLMVNGLTADFHPMSG